MLSCKIVSNSEGFEISTDISQKNEKCVLLAMSVDCFEKIQSNNIHNKQKELKFLFDLHSGLL
jgi:hypothetical protein